jgi:hypothetical protein
MITLAKYTNFLTKEKLDSNEVQKSNVEKWNIQIQKVRKKLLRSAQFWKWKEFAPKRRDFFLKGAKAHVQEVIMPWTHVFRGVHAEIGKYIDST